MNTIKSVSFIFGFVLTSFYGYGQMKAAKAIPPSVEKRVMIEAPVDTVWKYLLVFSNVEEFGSSIVLNAKIEGKGIGTVREVFFANGSKRKEEVVVISPRFKKIGFKVLNPNSLFSSYFYYFEVNRANDLECFVTIKTYYVLKDKVDKKDKKNLKRDVLKETGSFLEGLKNQLKTNKQ
ncbi:SRPBCC family protein [Cellulophaga omnivescoria]|uniref:SRPBCC family protein n=1 Tax=Cellulophaga omnivescoria TaxID=1888890 RepID=UPI000985618A|nr:SRPBCC family protein [Cellulophaga omnivescoria]